MDDVTIARAVHVLAVVHWIGALTTVTAVVLPAARRDPVPSRRAALFETIEARVAPQVKISVTLAGLSGFYMTHKLAAWERFLDPGFWWMHAMALLWALFTAILFVAEPLALHGWFARRAANDPDRALTIVQRAHWALLAASAITVGAAVLGAHGVL